MATKRETTVTVPTLAVQHKASALPASVVETQPTPGEDPVKDTKSSHILRPGAKHQTHMYPVWNTNLLQRKQQPLRKLLVRPKYKDLKEKARG